jgi:hypothetical protein
VENTQPGQEVEPNSMEEPKPDSIEVQDSTPKTDVAKPNGEANATEGLLNLKFAPSNSPCISRIYNSPIFCATFSCI